MLTSLSYCDYALNCDARFSYILHTAVKLEVKSGLFNLLIKSIQIQFIFVNTIFSTYGELIEAIVIVNKATKKYKGYN
jgi:hypothetical protein